MHLHSLEVHGFKSFADKTILDFHEGVTGIVGPNGCGKSNVVDAIRWVLGETSAKALRGGEMADVIFNGTDSRRPSGMAAVTLNLTDCEAALGVDFNEVAITRRVYRDGKSEYRINNTLCRLRDIHDLFLDTGIGRSAYSIMEQGKIDQLLSSKPEDRRAVFEEAAGISKFKKEKKEALRKLDLTSANLLRVSDVMEEQDRRINTLKRQVAKARRYKALSTDVKALETHLAHQEFRELLAGRNHLKTSLQNIEKEVTAQENTIPKSEAALLEQRSALGQYEQDTGEITKLLNDTQSEIKNAQGQIKLNAERRIDCDARIKRYDRDIESSQERLNDQQNDLKDTIKQVTKIQERIGSQQTILTEHKEQVESVRKERQAIETQQKEAEREQLNLVRQVASLNAKLESSRNNTSIARERVAALQEEHNAQKKSQASTSAQLTTLAAKLAAHATQKALLDTQKEETKRATKNLQHDLDAAHASLREEQKEHSARTSRLDVLQKLLVSGEGLGSGSQAVLSGLDDPKLYSPLLGGTLAKALRTDDQYITAIEAALGNHLHAIIIKDTEAATNIIETLSAKSLGTAELMVPSLSATQKIKQLPTAPKNSLGWALDLVSASKNAEHALFQLLENTLVVSDFTAALKLRVTYPDLRFVTLAGELITPEGFIQGGKADENSTSTLRLQNEIEELQREIKTREKALSKREKDIATLNKNLEEANKSVEKARISLQEHQLTTNNLKSEENAFHREATNISNKLDALSREKERLEQKQKDTTNNLEQLDQELKESQQRRQEVETTLQKFANELKAIREREVSSFDALSELQTAVAVERRSYDALQRQQEPLQVRIKELIELTAQRKAEIKTLQERIETSHKKDQELKDAIANSEAGVKQSTEKLDLLKTQITQGRQAIQTQETALADARRNLLHLTEKRGKEDVAYTKIDLRIENLATNQREKHQVELSEFTPKLALLAETLSRRGQSEPTEPLDTETSSTPEIEWTEVETLARDLRTRLDGMGSVNVDAIAEFEELEERHVFVLKQFEDLTNAKEELLNIIDRINKETTKMFAETFTAVRDNFRHMFKALFGEKGKADLVLSDDDDPLESGIEIIAKPPGKKLQSITLLSGGERSMTAVALLFSIYMVKPSPFCVLDELDAPLDESNISRFLNMLEEFISQSQFIIVTHNKRTMARCDVLYGVTMPELGVSKPLGMRLSQAEEIIDQNQRNQKSAQAKTDKSQSPAANAAAQISS